MREMDKDIAGKQRHFQHHAAVLPLAQRSKAWKKMFYLQMIEPGGSGLFLVCPDEQHKPLRKK